MPAEARKIEIWNADRCSGQKMTEVVVDREEGSVTVLFENGSELYIFVNDADEGQLCVHGD